MASHAFMSGEFFQRYQANNGVRSEERTTPASNLSEESTNLERNMENSICEDDKIVAVDVHPVAASTSKSNKRKSSNSRPPKRFIYSVFFCCLLNA